MKELFPTPSIFARVTFYTTQEGGRAGPTPADVLKCISQFGEDLFDCMVFLQGVGPVSPGETVLAPIRFLFPSLVQRRLSVGAKFHLRDYRRIASVEVLQVYPAPAPTRLEKARLQNDPGLDRPA